MAFARFVTWNLRPGTRDEALEILDGFSDEAKKTKGFKGIFAFRALDNPNTAYVLSLWDSEESLEAATNGLVPRVVKVWARTRVRARAYVLASLLLLI
jgi:heme-degrading monooxygenase HmoA